MSGEVDTLHVDESSLPIDISSTQASLLQRSVDEVGKVWFTKTGLTRVEFVVVGEDSDAGQIVQSVNCTTALDVRHVLQDLKSSNQRVLVIVLNDNEAREKLPSRERSKNGPCCSVSSIVAICNHFDVLPTFALALQRNPGLWLHVRPNEHKYHETTSETSEFGLDFSYSAPMPWLDIDKDHLDFMQSTLLSISNYTRLAADGSPTLTIFTGVSSYMVTAIKEKWLQCLERSTCSDILFADHLTVFSLGLHVIQQEVKLLEMIQQMYGAARFEIHAQNDGANIETTITNSRKFVTQLTIYCSALEALKTVMSGLTDDVSEIIASGPLQPTTLVSNEQSSRILKAWRSNLNRQLCGVQGRIKELIEEQAKTENMIMSYIAQRDSKSFRNNTEQLASIAQATEKSGNEVHAMTQRMEKDAREMKFLAEVTAFFLPLTALATFFSMDFLSLTSTTSGLLPQMDNIKFIWVYVIALVLVSVGVFGWWGYKHHTSFQPSVLSKPDGNSVADESVEGDSTISQAAIKNQILATARKARARSLLTTLMAERDQREANEKDDSNSDTNADSTSLLMEILYCGRAAETGEDFSEQVPRLALDYTEQVENSNQA